LEKKKIECEIVLILSTTFSETFVILRRAQPDMIKMYIGLHTEKWLFLTGFNEICVSSTEFREILGYQIA